MTMPDNPDPQHSVEQLMALAAEWASAAGNTRSADVCDVRVKACLDFARIRLATSEQEIRMVEIELAREANSLTKKLLKSNEEASRQAENNAVSMNDATKELARSTSSLNRATWVLVAVTAIQAVIAVLSFLRK